MGKPVDTAKIFYISKSDENTYEVTVKLRKEETIRSEFLMKATALKMAVDTDEPPERVKEAPDHWECGFCPHFQRCFKSEKVLERRKKEVEDEEQRQHND